MKPFAHPTLAAITQARRVGNLFTHDIAAITRVGKQPLPPLQGLPRPPQLYVGATARRKVLRRSGFNQTKPQAGKCGGFTLLEMLVVIALLGVVAGVVISALDSAVDDSLVPITQNEMVEIGKALRNFKRDNGDYPTPSHPADFSDLIAGTASSPPTGYDEWNINTSRGWRGPYVSKQGGGLVTVCSTLSADGTGSINSCTSTDVVPDVVGVADAFEHKPFDNGTPDNLTDDTMVWRACADDTNVACNKREKWGGPYLLFDMQSEHPRIVSMGSDGKYDGVNTSDTCVPNNDDLVLCLK